MCDCYPYIFNEDGGPRALAVRVGWRGYSHYLPVQPIEPLWARIWGHFLNPIKRTPGGRGWVGGGDCLGRKGVGCERGEGVTCNKQERVKGEFCFKVNRMRE